MTIMIDCHSLFLFRSEGFLLLSFVFFVISGVILGHYPRDAPARKLVTRARFFPFDSRWPPAGLPAAASGQKRLPAFDIFFVGTWRSGGFATAARCVTPGRTMMI